MKVFLAGLLALMSQGAVAAAAGPVISVVDHVVPISVEIAGAAQPAVLRGVVRVERNLLPWYTLTLHASARMTTAAQLERGLEACRLTLIWQENQATAEMVHSYFSGLFEQTSAYAGQDAMVQRIARFVGGLPAARRGQVWQFDYWPDGGMQFRIDGQLQQHVSGIDMNRALLGLWLGGSADPAIRAGLFIVPAR